MARPTKLTPAIQERVVKAVRAGNYADAAARAAGISPSTHYRWMKRGEAEQSGTFRDFFEAIRTAEAEAEVHAVATLRRAMPDDWRAALAYLERRHPERWRRRQTTELVGEDGSPFGRDRTNQLDLSKLSDEEVHALAQLVERASQAG